MAVSVVELTKVVLSERPLSCATLPLAKPEPVMVTVTDALPTTAEEGLTELIVGPGVEVPVEIAIERLCAADTFPVEVAVTLKVKGLPVVVVGVPLIRPVAGVSVRPGGSVPEAPLLLVRHPRIIESADMLRGRLATECALCDGLPRPSCRHWDLR